MSEQSEHIHYKGNLVINNWKHHIPITDPDSNKNDAVECVKAGVMVSMIPLLLLTVILYCIFLLGVLL